jgi:hypothetical protein
MAEQTLPRPGTSENALERLLPSDTLVGAVVAFGLLGIGQINFHLDSPAGVWSRGRIFELKPRIHPGRRAVRLGGASPHSYQPQQGAR